MCVCVCVCGCGCVVIDVAEEEGVLMRKRRDPHTL